MLVRFMTSVAGAALSGNAGEELDVPDSEDLRRLIAAGAIEIVETKTSSAKARRGSGRAGSTRSKKKAETADAPRPEA